MARQALCAIVCAGVALALSPLAGAGDAEVKSRILTRLEVQKALEVGREHVQKGNFQSAVQVLESKIHLIDGNREYLRTLREAYIGHLRELDSAKRAGEAKDYRARLAILGPGARPPQPAPAPATPAAPVTPAGGVVGRGKVDEPDPFADSNRVEAHKAKALVARAEQAFEQKNYQSANRFYAQAHEAWAEATSGCRERWAYCKLNAVVDALNGKGSETPSAPDLEREVQQALKMSPKMEALGNDLLRKVRERLAEVKVEVKHTPRKDKGWALAETTNFRIFHAQTPQQAERAARVAEAARAAMARKWLGEVLPAWSPRCDIYFHANMADYARATGAPESNPGHSTISMDAGRVVERRIDLHCDDRHLMEATLPHETTHVVLAGKFGRHLVPRWADEGMAVLSEPRARIELHLRNLPAHRRDGHLFGVGQLVRMENYPEARFVGPFYAQSVSLVEYLVTKKGPRTFTSFLRDGLDSGYEGALRKHYGITGFGELERQWREHAFGASVAAVTEKRR